MTMGRPKTELVLTEDERSQLQSFARSRSLPSALSDRARIVLSSADGEANNSIAQRLKLTNATVDAPPRSSVTGTSSRTSEVTCCSTPSAACCC